METARERAVRTFRSAYGREPELVVRAPGRVNLLGEHVDYNDGWVMPCALERAAWVAAARSDRTFLEVRAADVQAGTGGAPAMIPLKGLTARQSNAWPAYPAGVVWALQEAGYTLGGLQTALASDVPIGAGLSSSAAVEVAFAWVWRTLFDLPLDRMAVAKLCQRAENEFVGVACGIMDQFASACGVEGQVLWLDCRDLSFSPVPWPAGMALVISDSHVSRTLAGSAYNQRRAECAEGLAILQRHLPGARALRDVSTEEFDALARHVPEPVRTRCRHVVTECARVLSAVESLRAGDVTAFGAAMRESHISLRDDYAVSAPELDVLVEAAWAAPGCYGSRLTGAGFGGCTVSIVAEDAVEAFVAHVQDAYHAGTGRTAGVYVEHPAAGVGDDGVTG